VTGIVEDLSFARKNELVGGEVRFSVTSPSLLCKFLHGKGVLHTGTHYSHRMVSLQYLETSVHVSYFVKQPIMIEHGGKYFDLV